MNIDDLSTFYRANETLLTSLGVLAAVSILLLVANRLRHLTEHRLTPLVANILTVVAAALATMVSASGMWKFFTDVLGPSPLRIVFFAYIETALFASALLARARLLREPEKGTTGVDGIAVWVLASLTATLSALDADSFHEVCLRLVAPLVAAWMWERALAAERSARLGRTTTGIHWTLTLERILVWLRLAEAHGRDVSEVDRARRRAQLGRARLTLHLLQNRKTAAWRVRRAHNKVIRQAMRAAEHIGLADLPHASNEREAIQMYMATLYGFVDATSPQAVAHLNAWQPTATTREPNDTAVARPLNDVWDGTDPDPTVPMPAATVALTDSVARTYNGHGPGDMPSGVGNDVGPANRGAHDDIPVPGKHGLGRGATTGITNKPGHRNRQAAVPGEPLTQARHNDPTTHDHHAGAADNVDTSAVAAMRRFWDSQIADGRIPTGAQLSRAAGVPPNTGLGRRKRREWQVELPEHLKAAADTSR